MKSAIFKNRKLILAMAALAATNAQAGGSGTRDGGHVIDVDGRPELMDLATSAVCEWKSAADMVAQTPDLARVLSRLSALDWYFAADLEQEILSLQFCLTGILFPVPSHDPYPITWQPEAWRARQAALRIGDEIYVNREIFGAMSPYSQAMLLIHEAMHYYFPQTDPNRRLHLMTMVNGIGKVAAGIITSRSELHRNMERNQMQFPRTVDQLDAHRASIQFVLSDDAARKQLVLSMQTPEQISMPTADFDTLRPLLAPWIQNVESPENALVRTLQLLMIDADAATFDRLLNQKTYRELNPALIAMSVADQLSAANMQILLVSRQSAAVMDQAVQILGAANAIRGEQRILSTPELQALSASSARGAPAPLTDLVPRSARGSTALPIELQAAAQLVRLHVLANQWTEITQVCTGNAQFMSALQLTQARASTQAMSPTVPREKDYALQTLSELSRGLRRQFSAVVTQGVSAEQRQIFERMFGL